MLLDILNCTRVRLESSTQFYQSNFEFVQLLMNLRNMIEAKNEFVDMTYHSLSKICGNEISGFRMNKYFNSGFLIGYSDEESFKCYGNSSVVFQNSEKIEFKVPKLYVTDTPKNLYDKFVVGREYYVYLHYVDGIPAYVGKGIRNRMQGSKENLIKTHGLEDKDVRSMKIASNLTERDAFELEAAYMRAIYMSGGKLLNSAMSKGLAKELLDLENERSEVELTYYKSVDNQSDVE